MPEKIERDFSRRERRTKTPEQALSSLMRLCARAEKSSGDALRLMAGWGVSSADAHALLDILVRDKFIDDRRYAEAYVREKSKLNGWGVFKIRRMLGTKGIARDTIESVLARMDREVCNDKLKEMIERKKRTVKADGTYELKGKLMRYGMGLGYGYDQVQDVVEQIVKE